jgi:hypothetical protein
MYKLFEIVFLRAVILIFLVHTYHIYFNDLHHKIIILNNKRNFNFI